MNFKISLLLLSAFLLTGCEKVIQVDVDAAEQKMVIEGVITNIAGDAKVMITKTKILSDTSGFRGITGAEVSVTGSNGRRFRFEEVETGIYTNKGLVAVPGVIYSLNVKLEGKIFTASSTMPRWARADSVFMTTDFLVNKNIRVANVAFTDDPKPGNAYLFEQYINRKKVDGLYIMNDDYTNGRPNVQKLFYFPGKDETGIQPGDTILINFFNIEPQIYKYWFSVLRSSIGQSGPSSPSNPVSNLQGGALGYFSAQSRETFEIVAK